MLQHRGAWRTLYSVKQASYERTNTVDSTLHEGARVVRCIDQLSLTTTSRSASEEFYFTAV